MIVVKVELHSAIDGSTTLLGRMTLANDGKLVRENKRRSTYIAKIWQRPRFGVITRRAKVENWPRADRTVWQLVHAALNQLYPKSSREP